MIYLMAMKEFLSSLSLMLSWFVFAISAYFLYLTITSMILIIPFIISLVLGLLLFYLSGKLDDRKDD